MILPKCGNMPLLGFARCPQIRFVALARSQSFNQCISALVRNDRCTLNLVVPLHGGGAKTEHILSVKAELAKLCINSGIPLQQVSPFVEQVFNRIGLQEVQHILTGKGDNWSELQSVCKEVSLPVPATNKIDIARRWPNIASRYLEEAQHSLQ